MRWGDTSMLSSWAARRAADSAVSMVSRGGRSCGESEIGVQPDRPDQPAHCLEPVTAITSRQQIGPAQIGVVRRGTRGEAAHPRTVPRRKVQSERDGSHYVALHLQQVGCRRLVSLRPEIEAFAHVYQMSGHSDAPTGPADGTLENGANTQPLSQLDRVGLGRAAQRPRQLSHAETGQLTQSPHQLGPDPVAQVVVRRIGVGIEKGKHGNRAGTRPDNHRLRNRWSVESEPKSYQQEPAYRDAEQ